MNKLLGLILYLILSTYSLSQESEIEKVIWEFSCFKYPDTEFIIDYKQNQLNVLSKLRFRYIEKDTILFNKTYKFTNNDLKTIKETLNQNIPDSITTKSERGHDGFQFQLTYYKISGDTSKLKIRLPERNSEKYTQEFKKIDAFFDFAYSIVKDEEGIKVLDETYLPYFSGTPIRKVNETPLEYKIWGSISGNAKMNYGFLEFLYNLPNNECVIIDCNNKLSYAWQEDILRLFIIKNSNIHFINNDYLKYTREDLLDIRNKIKEVKNNQEKLNNLKRNSSYHLYIYDPVGIDKWLELTSEQIFKSIEEIRKNCR